MPKKLTLKQAVENLKCKGHTLLDKEFINTKSNVNYICGFCGKEAVQIYYRIMLDISHGCKHKGFAEINKRKRFVTLHKNECEQCGIVFYDKSKNRIFCSKKCVNINFEINEKYNKHSKNLKQYSTNRSKNEIFFSDLCKNKWGREYVKYNEPIFDGFDADIVIEKLKLAIEWNGIWHYKKIRKGQKFNNTRARDIIKAKRIRSHNYDLIIFKDLGNANHTKIQKSFKKLLNILESKILKSLQYNEILEIDVETLKHRYIEIGNVYRIDFEKERLYKLKKKINKEIIFQYKLKLIKKYVSENKSYREIGRLVEFSNAHVFRICKKYNI